MLEKGDGDRYQESEWYWRCCSRSGLVVDGRCLLCSLNIECKQQGNMVGG